MDGDGPAAVRHRHDHPAGHHRADHRCVGAGRNQGPAGERRSHSQIHRRACGRRYLGRSGVDAAREPGSTSGVREPAGERAGHGRRRTRGGRRHREVTGARDAGFPDRAAAGRQQPRASARGWPARLHRGRSAGCGVDSPDRCPAARRAQVQQFANSDDLDACPKLRGRPAGAVSAVCVPVSIMGRTVGVIHATGEPDVCVRRTTGCRTWPPWPSWPGASIGLLRVMDETQLQAATDSLTGLLNRRSFEQQVAARPPGRHPCSPSHGRPRPFQAAQRHLRPRDRVTARCGCSPRC